MDPLAICYRVLNNVAVLSEVYFNFFGGCGVRVFWQLDYLFHVTVDVVHDDKPPWEDLFYEFVRGLDLYLVVVVGSSYLRLLEYVPCCPRFITSEASLSPFLARSTCRIRSLCKGNPRY